jgi:hypothetical protein
MIIRRSTALLCVWRKYGGTIPGWRQDFRVISPFFTNLRGRSFQSLFFFFWLETTRFFFLFKSINTIAAVGDIFLEKAAVSVSATTKKKEKEPTPSRVNAAHYGRSSENVNNRKLERNPRKIKEKSSRSRFRLFCSWLLLLSRRWRIWTRR